MNRPENQTSVGTLRWAFSLPKRGARKMLREFRAAVEPSNIQRLERKFILPVRNAVLRNKPVVAQLVGNTIKLVPEGALAAGIWSGANFEPAELALVSRLLTPDSVFFDVGANAGVYSIVASKVSPSAKIYAFEPAQRTFALLDRNLQLNGARNVTAVQLALGNFSGEATLNLNVPGKDGLNTMGALSHPDTEGAGQEIVPISTLDAYVSSARIGRVDVMKVDAEGAELSIFEGARGLLQRADAPAILYEAFSFITRGFDYHPVEIYWLLDGYGFACFMLNSETGKLTIPRASRAYDSMILAVKPSHAAYKMIEELAH